SDLTAYAKQGYRCMCTQCTSSGEGERGVVTLHWWELDKDLLVWGTAQDGRVVATGRGYDGKERADALWDPHDESTGDIAYYHPDSGWTNAATGNPIEMQRDDQERER
ncbi:MAG: hypothetical protein ACRDXB_00265, partial [Actinomycetes bacterium]